MSSTRWSVTRVALLAFASGCSGELVINPPAPEAPTSSGRAFSPQRTSYEEIQQQRQSERGSLLVREWREAEDRRRQQKEQAYRDLMDWRKNQEDQARRERQAQEAEQAQQDMIRNLQLNQARLEQQAYEQNQRQWTERWNQGARDESLRQQRITQEIDRSLEWGRLQQEWFRRSLNP
jgi:hypothetical protein